MYAQTKKMKGTNKIPEHVKRWTMEKIQNKW